MLFAMDVTLQIKCPIPKLSLGTPTVSPISNCLDMAYNLCSFVLQAHLLQPFGSREERSFLDTNKLGKIDFLRRGHSRKMLELPSFTLIIIAIGLLLTFLHNYIKQLIDKQSYPSWKDTVPSQTQLFNLIVLSHGLENFIH